MPHRSSSGSFSLPSAGGMVSLLNDARGKEGENGKPRSPSHLSVPQSGHLSNNSSTSNSPSPFSSNHPSGGESGTSLTSVQPSTDSSRDDGLESGKVARNFEDTELDRTQIAKSDGATLPPPLPRTDTNSSSSPSIDDEEVEAMSKKRRRPSDSRNDETLQSRGASMKKMLDSSRLARSPPPLRSRGDDSSTDSGKDVPMSMHRATGAALEDVHGGRNEPEQSSQPSRRASMGSSSSKNASSGRKGNSNSQMIGGKKRYPCSFPGCDKTFSTSGHAARHNRIHTGSKPYRCTFPGCNASFSRQDNSLQHYRTHVLHPKSRSGGSVSLDANQIDSAVLDGELSNLDPETVATVQMGRKALEEGTAIAVVQEFIDGNGRRAEAVQRMVGQPKTGRRGSMTAQDASEDWAGHSAPAKRRMSLDEQTGARHSPMRDQKWAFYPPAHHGYPPYGPSPPSGPPFDDGMRYPGLQPHHQHGHPLEHHPGPHVYAHGGHPHAPNHSGYASEPVYYAHGPAPPPRYYDHPPLPLRAGPSTSYGEATRAMYAPGFGDRVRRSSDNTYMTSAAFPPMGDSAAHFAQSQSTAYHSPPTHHHAQPYGDIPPPHDSHHRRSVSVASAGPHGPAHEYRRPLPPPHEDQMDMPSPSFSVRSFRSEGPYGAQPRDDRGSALSLLSNAAVQNGKVSLPPPTTSPMAPMKRSPPSVTAPISRPPPSSLRARSSTTDMHLPLPHALSKVPYSSDRSTNVLTPKPATPVADLASQPPPPSSTTAMPPLNAPRHADRDTSLDQRELPPLRSHMRTIR